LSIQQKLFSAPLSIFGGPSRTDYDIVRFPVHRGWNGIIDNGTHGTNKILLKAQWSEDFA